MAGAETIHRVSRRGAFEYYRETACPECEGTVYVPEGEANPRRFDDLEIFKAHACKALFPVDLGSLPHASVTAFRTTVETVFGKPLRRFNGAMQGKGLPLHFTPDWQPHLGHVPAFSKSDVHRPLDAADPVLAAIIPPIRKHFGKEAKTSLRKYYLNREGVTKRERIGSKDVIRQVIRWRWPAR